MTDLLPNLEHDLVDIAGGVNPLGHQLQLLLQLELAADVGQVRILRFRVVYGTHGDPLLTRRLQAAVTNVRLTPPQRDAGCDTAWTRFTNRRRAHWSASRAHALRRFAAPVPW